VKSKHAAPLFFAIAAAWFSAPLALAGGSTLAVISAWPPHVSDADEDPTKRASRLTEIADAIDGATGDRQERAALLTLIRYESGAASHVQRGECKPHECDKGRATGIYQLHGDVPVELAGQTSRALGVWRFGFKRCARSHPDPIAGAFQSYGSGGHCAPSKWSAKRAATMRGLVSRL